VTQQVLQLTNHMPYSMHTKFPVKSSRSLDSTSCVSVSSLLMVLSPFFGAYLLFNPIHDTCPFIFLSYVPFSYRTSMSTDAPLHPTLEGEGEGHEAGIDTISTDETAPSETEYSQIGANSNVESHSKMLQEPSMSYCYLSRRGSIIGSNL
jgi:hypothetical protein